MRFNLSEEDAARYGCDRVVEFEQSKLTLRDLIALDKLGYPADRLADIIEGSPVLDAAGNERHQVDAAGKQVLDEDGKPIPLRVFNPEALLAMVWICVRRATGKPIEWETFDIALEGLLDLADADAGDLGKETNRASRRAAKATKPRSRTPSASRPGSSTKS